MVDTRARVPSGVAMKTDMLRPREVSRLVGKSWSVSWPMIVIMFLDFAIYLTDVYIAGTLGTDVQAAVGFVGQFYFIFIVAANALTVGTVSLCARLFGNGDREELAVAIRTAVVSCLVAGVALGLAVMTVSGPFVQALNIPARVKDLGTPLVRILGAGLVFHYFLITTNGVLRSCGRVKSSLAAMAVACAVNVALNFILVYRTTLGYYGITISTVAGYIAGFACNAWSVKNLDVPRGRYDRGKLSEIAKIGWPSGLQQIAWQTGSLVLVLIISAVPRDTVTILAAFTNGFRIESAIFLPAFAFNMANAVIAGNLIGARRFREAFSSCMATAGLGVAFISAMALIVVLNAGSLAGALSGNPDVVRESVRYLWISMASEPFMAWAVITSGALNGAGDTRTVMRIVVGSQWLVRLPCAWFFGVHLGYGPPAIWWSMNASILVHAILVTLRYAGKRWLPGESADAAAGDAA